MFAFWFVGCNWTLSEVRAGWMVLRNRCVGCARGGLFAIENALDCGENFAATVYAHVVVKSVLFMCLISSARDI